MKAGGDRETRAALSESARRWIETSYGEDRRRRTLAGTGFDAAAWAEMAELGWFGVMAPEEQGGLGLGCGDLAVIAEAVGAGNLPEPLLAVAGVVVPLLAAAAGAQDGVANLLERVLSGASTATLAHAEPNSGFDRTLVATTARREGDGWRLDGTKAMVEAAPKTDTFLVSAATDDGPELFLVDRAAPGLSVTAYRAMDGRVMGDVLLDRVRVSGESRLQVAAADALDAALDRGALLAMAEAVGAMSVVFEDTLNHLRTRRQFGQPLASFQVLQHRAVNMFIALEEARAVVESAGEPEATGDREFGLAVATAKVVGARSARLISREAVQLHGGIGITEELRVSHLFRRLVVLESLYGDDDAYLGRFQNLYSD